MSGALRPLDVSVIPSFNRQKLLKESSYPSLLIDEVDLENPIPRSSVLVGISHSRVILRVNVILEFFSLEFLVREIADEVTAMRLGIVPTPLLCKLKDELIQLSPSYVWM
jgi:hypothetical protein